MSDSIILVKELIADLDSALTDLANRVGCMQQTECSRRKDDAQRIKENCLIVIKRILDITEASGLNKIEERKYMSIRMMILRAHDAINNSLYYLDQIPNADLKHKHKQNSYIALLHGSRILDDAYGKCKESSL